MRIRYYLMILFGALASTAVAQHDHHTQPKPDTTKNRSHSAHGGGHDQDSTLHHQMPPMSHAFSLNLPMTRNGSGTGWLPDASPMYGYMLHSKKWMYMFHGNVFLRYNNQDIANKGSRGDSKVDAPNWLMAMGQRRIGSKGLFHFNVMLSLDPVFGGDGYPLLFQTGETYNGKPLVDRQHPHDLFSELSISYTQSFSKDVDVFLYLAYPGEPALGPVAFMHRPSALNNPDATLGHHWQDASHITFGVATAGVRYKIFKLDGSLFTGREPNEKRYDLDKPRFDSYSYRLTANPHSNLSMQVSRAFIKSPESIEPDENVTRTTASFLHSLPLIGNNKSITSAVIWGYNDAGEDHKENSFTVESNLQLDRLAIYGRFENVEKSAGELQLTEFEAHDLFRINALTLGANFAIFRSFKTNFSLGAQATLYSADSSLDDIYGVRPTAFEVYLRVSPMIMNLTK